MVDLYQSPGAYPVNGGTAVDILPVRLMNEGDIDWLIDICKRRYSDHYDSTGAEGWFRNIVLKLVRAVRELLRQNVTAQVDRIGHVGD